MSIWTARECTAHDALNSKQYYISGKICEKNK